MEVHERPEHGGGLSDDGRSRVRPRKAGLGDSWFAGVVTTAASEWSTTACRMFQKRSFVLSIVTRTMLSGLCGRSIDDEM